MFLRVTLIIWTLCFWFPGLQHTGGSEEMRGREGHSEGQRRIEGGSEGGKEGGRKAAGKYQSSPPPSPGGAEEGLPHPLP